MKIKTVKSQINAMEKQLNIHRKNYVETRISYERNSAGIRYLWLLLPISAFAIGYRKNTVIVTTLVRFLKSQAFYLLRQNVQSKLILTLLG